MSEELNTGLTLLVVGMITVFSILFLVVTSGKVLTLVVNKYYPAKKIRKVWDEVGIKTDELDRRVITAILTAVELATEGKGKVTQIQKK